MKYSHSIDNTNDTSNKNYNCLKYKRKLKLHGKHQNK